jgi:hypothetical protein
MNKTVPVVELPMDVDSSHLEEGEVPPMRSNEIISAPIKIGDNIVFITYAILAEFMCFT